MSRGASGLAPRVRRMGDWVQVARREAFEAKRIEQAGVLADEHLCDLAADADHLVSVVRVEDRVDVQAHVVEDGEVVGRERADAAGAGALVEPAATLEPAQRVRKRSAPKVGKTGNNVHRRGKGVQFDLPNEG